MQHHQLNIRAHDVPDAADPREAHDVVNGGPPVPEAIDDFEISRPGTGHQDAGLWNGPFASFNTAGNWLAMRSDCRILFRNVATRVSSAL